MTIFDRIGEMVYSSDNIEEGWDGTFKNKDLNPDVFVWMAEVLFIDGVTEIFSGDVTLVR